MSKEYTITPQGSLGLLALGHVGIKRWKEVVAQEKINKSSGKNKIKDGDEKK
jgi:hypothetical protein